jgi:hypothetical protein
MEQATDHRGGGTMGLRAWLDKRAEARAREAYEREYAAWQDEVRDARAYLEVAQEFEGFTKYDSPEDMPIVLKSDERVFLVLSGVGLIEPRRQRGRYEGGSHGVSLRIANGVSYRVGAHRGTFVEGDEVSTLVDEGVGVVTDRRVVFQGSQQTREWAFAKLIGVQHGAGLTMLHVSNRQMVSGLVYGNAVEDDVEFRLDLAVARFSGEVDQMISALKARVQELEERRPTPPPRTTGSDNANASQREP